ncbi:tetratricopeptide repeat protein [Hymenobacter chitinivorans]|uniref:Tetratricopeptide repeat protein n=1 Tax=Hymenobacter chitinivorans DSM 11115 TaxID=1121954 RepID=A0A2M9BRC8_9BACT|nr:tetratricopeptide repeat protein [Hymenobacter chitinivorans]PJJ60505.1 tetratricopeptide repeat protein [Hymenobacter chitinivorans DSM 11115]
MPKTILLLLLLCLGAGPLSWAQRDAEQPRYAGRPQTAAQRQADQEFVTQALQQYKTRAAASETYVDEGWTAFYQEKYSQALQSYNRAWLLDSASANVFYGFSAYLTKRGTPAAAARYFALAQQRDPQRLGARTYYVRLADLQEKLGDRAGVLDSYQEIIKLDPGNATAYRVLGTTYAAMQDSARARQHLRKALSLNPADSATYFGLGQLAYARQDYARAVATYSQALRLNPRYLDAYAARGLAYEQQGQLPQAVADYSKCLEMAEFVDKGQFYRMLGVVQIKLEDPSACESLRQALRWGDAAVGEKELKRILKEHCR